MYSGLGDQASEIRLPADLGVAQPRASASRPEASQPQAGASAVEGVGAEFADSSEAQAAWTGRGRALPREGHPAGKGATHRQEAAHLEGQQGTGVPCRAEYPNHVWTYDFVFDVCENGRTLKFLTLLDEFTRQSLAIEVDVRLSSRQVIEVLERIAPECGRPAYLRSDNGPEFIAKQLRQYLAEHGSQTRYIDPGSPWQNAYGESFNGKFRDEFLDQEVFHSPAHARVLAGAWQRHYNTERPHSSLGYLTPAEFAASVA